VEEREPGRFGHRAQVLVVGHDGGQLAAQRARPPPEDQVVQAVPLSGHHDQHPRCAVAEQGEGHPELARDRAELLGQPLLGGIVADPEGGAQEQPVAHGVVELLVFDDVPVVVEEEPGDRVDDAGPLRTAQGQGEGLHRGGSLSTRRR